MIGFRLRQFQILERSCLITFVLRYAVDVIYNVRLVNINNMISKTDKKDKGCNM